MPLHDGRSGKAVDRKGKDVQILIVAGTAAVAISAIYIADPDRAVGFFQPFGDSMPYAAGVARPVLEK